MRWLKVLFGPRESAQSDRRGPTPGRSIRTAAGRRSGAEPWDYMSAGLDAWSGNDFSRAEQLLRRGVDAYRRSDPAGVDFALGRLGAFLLDRDRVDEAAQVLEQAIAQRTDIPAVWSDYLEIMARRRDVDGLFDAARRSIEHVRSAEPPWHDLLAHARRADRAGDSGFAEAVAGRVASDAVAAGDQHAHWMAIGNLGHILERAGQLDRALGLWKTAFAQGSADPTTANRLSMSLERTRDYPGAVGVIEAALDRNLPANVEEQLRKRLDRCRARIQGRKRSDVAAFSVRVGEGDFDIEFQVRVRPPVRAASIHGSIARCFGISKGVGILVDISLVDGAEVSRQTGLSPFNEIHFSPQGWGLGTVRSGRIGEGVTKLTFLSPSGTVVRIGEVPDATSEVAFAPDIWYVGCRDGRLYGFRPNGERLWHWETPGARAHRDSVYTRPCPYYVSSDGRHAAISSMGDVFYVSSAGKTLWHFRLPNEASTVHTLSIPLAGELSRRETYDELALSPGAPPAEVKSAYRRRALETHPDHHPDNPEAAAAFRRVHAAYEAIMSGQATEEGGSAIEVSITMAGMDPTVSHMIATRESVFVGSTDGKLYTLGPTGDVAGVHALGDSWLRPVVDAHGALIAAWCDGTIFYLEDDELRNLDEFEEVPNGIGSFADGLYLWHGNHLSVVNRGGRTVWSVEFLKRISSVAARGEHLVCAAGVLAAFRRVGGGGGIRA